jgi:phage recombination protein Bet
MENQIVKYVSNQMQIELTPELVKSCLVRGGGNVTNEEITLFMNLCAYRQLNPFLNECYLIKYSTAPVQIVTNYEVFLNRADANSHYKGKKQGVIVEVDGQEITREGKRLRKGERLLAGWCRVLRDDRDDEYCEVDFEEYNKNQSTWKTMPATMIVKVAVSQALRQAFPNELSGLYSDAEEAKLGDIIDITPLKTVAEPQRKSQSQSQSTTPPQSGPGQSQSGQKLTEKQVNRFYAIVKTAQASGVTEDIARIILDSHVPNNRDAEGHFLWSNVSKSQYDILCEMFETGTWKVYFEELQNA